MTGGRQQNVAGVTGVADPIGSPPPLAPHAPGVYVVGPADLLPSAEPAIRSTQTGLCESTKSDKRGVEQFPSDHTDTSAVHLPPDGDPHVHVEQPRASSALA